jgi:hypothetical protein
MVAGTKSESPAGLNRNSHLHEIGHIKGRHQRSPDTLVRERWAWRWAKENALIWTPAMEKNCSVSLAWYEARRAPPEKLAGPKG